VCVLSVGRSGSSLVARAINLVGVHLGAEEDLIPASEQNERGFWESRAIYRLNEELLGLLGGSWYAPPELEPGWERDERLDELRVRAGDIVRDLALPGRRWGFKEGRTIVLLPFWRGIVGEMDYVICVRRAHAFVRSAEAFAPPEGKPRASARLWLDMNAAAIGQTVDARRMLVFYEDWFEDPRRMARQLAAFVHGDVSAVDPKALDAVVAFFDPTLRRADSRGQPAELAEAPELEAMYAHLRLTAESDGEGPEARRRHALVAQTLAGGYQLRQRLRDDLRSSEQAAASLRDSNSWRMTAPLRLARRRVQEQLGGGRGYVRR
jgi:hypothetical protein